MDENQGRIRPSKAAFDDHPDGSPMSVLLAEILITSGRQAVDALSGHQRFGLAAITAGLVRSKQQGVATDPLPDEPAHALVIGRKTDSVKRAFAKASEWIIPPIIESQP
jgi:hypothetical protein